MNGTNRRQFLGQCALATAVAYLLPEFARASGRPEPWVKFPTVSSAGWNYISDLIGCIVFDANRELGKIEDVQFGAGEAPLLIVGTGSKRYEIPYAEAYLKSLDLEHKQIQMQLPEGMLEVNAPLTAEEKQQQAERQKAAPQNKKSL